MFNLELPGRVAKGAVSAATYHRCSWGKRPSGASPEPPGAGGGVQSPGSTIKHVRDVLLVSSMPRNINYDLSFGRFRSFS